MTANKTIKHTTSSGWARSVARTLNRCGMDSQSIFSQAGISDDIWSLSDFRIEKSAMDKVWDLVNQQTQDECFGLTVAEHISLSNLNFLGHALLASDSLYSLFKRLEKFGDSISAYGEGFSEVIDDKFYAHIKFSDYEKEHVNPTPIDAFIAFIMILIRDLKGYHFNPIHVNLIRSKPANNSRFEDFFHCPVSFDSNHITLVFDNHEVQKTLLTGNPQLAMQFEHLTEQYLASFQDSFGEQVKNTIKITLESGRSSQDCIAEQLNLSTRTLRYRLKEENLLFKNLKEQARKELAEVYLSQNRSISDICFLLGFNDSSSFTKAYKKWYGHPPSAYSNQEHCSAV